MEGIIRFTGSLCSNISRQEAYRRGVWGGGVFGLSVATVQHSGGKPVKSNNVSRNWCKCFSVHQPELTDRCRQFWSALTEEKLWFLSRNPWNPHSLSETGVEILFNFASGGFSIWMTEVVLKIWDLWTFTLLRNTEIFFFSKREALWPHDVRLKWKLPLGFVSGMLCNWCEGAFCSDI